MERGLIYAFIGCKREREREREREQECGEENMNGFNMKNKI